MTVCALGTELFDRVVGLLLPFMGTINERQTELYPVVHGKPVSQAIQWEGPAKQFTVRLVALLPHDLLLAVLGRLVVGEGQRAEIADVCARIREESIFP